LIEVRRTERFDKWLAAVRDGRARAIISARLFRLTRGLVGDVKPIGEGVSELRVNYGPGYRVYIVQRGAALVIVLGGGDKASQDRDIRDAKAYAKEV
jgi:putative addiction module killer protein